MKKNLFCLFFVLGAMSVVAQSKVYFTKDISPHASADITSRVYAHLMSEVQVRITQTISGVLR